MSDDLKQPSEWTKPTLVVLAAGMGNRYGGLKQIDPVGPHDELIIDYAIYDALAAGFGKIVFVIRREFEAAFRLKIDDSVGDRIETAYVYQDIDDSSWSQRRKPWGTGHAVLCAREEVDRPFAVINADDYYGSGAMRLVCRYLQDMGVGGMEACAMVGYALDHTLSPYGTVCRGICSCTNNGFLQHIEEMLELQRDGQAIVGRDERGQGRSFQGGEIVSLNLWGFSELMFPFLADLFSEFLGAQDPQSDEEFYLPATVDILIRRGVMKVKVLPTKDSWFGVTYPADWDLAVTHIRRLIDAGMYPENLWS